MRTGGSPPARCFCGGGQGGKEGALDPAETSRSLWNQARRRRRSGRRGRGGGGGRCSVLRAPPLSFSAPPPRHVTTAGGSPCSRSVARSVSSLPPPCPSSPQFPSLRPPPPPSPRPNSDSSREAPAPPPFSSLAHWLRLQGRVPRAGSSHWWDEQSEFPDEGTFCSIKGAGKAGDSAV